MTAAETLIANEIPVTTLADSATELDRLLPAALAGDGPALLAVAGLVERTPEGVTLALASLLRLAASAETQEAERLLAAAAVPPGRGAAPRRPAPGCRHRRRRRPHPLRHPHPVTPRPNLDLDRRTVDVGRGAWTWTWTDMLRA